MPVRQCVLLYIRETGEHSVEVGDDGTLTPVDRVQIGVKANWVRFVT